MNNNMVREENPVIREVWASNFDEEMSMLDECLKSHSILSIDTEFPGSIRITPWESSDQRLYEDFRFNVNKTKLIQLGLTATDELGNVGGTWEFNFSDFDLQKDVHNPSSISFLKKHDLYFHKINRDGIPLSDFSAPFLQLIWKNRILNWITFHGLYDIGYLLKALGVANELPKSIESFAQLVLNILGNVSDLKHMARFCEGLENGKLGLERLSKLLGEERFGLMHHAGSDSLLTASLHFKMMKYFPLNYEFCDGYLFGFSNKLEFLNLKVYHHQQQNIITSDRVAYDNFAHALLLYIVLITMSNNFMYNEDDESMMYYSL